MVARVGARGNRRVFGYLGTRAEGFLRPGPHSRLNRCTHAHFRPAAPVVILRGRHEDPASGFPGSGFPGSGFPARRRTRAAVAGSGRAGRAQHTLPGDRGQRLHHRSHHRGWADPRCSHRHRILPRGGGTGGGSPVRALLPLGWVRISNCGRRGRSPCGGWTPTRNSRNPARGQSSGVPESLAGPPRQRPMGLATARTRWMGRTSGTRWDAHFPALDRIVPGAMGLVEQ